MSEAVSLRLREEAARDVLLVWALEDSDRSAELLAHETRRAATREALAVGDDDGFVARRAEALRSPIAEALGQLRRWIRVSDPLAGWSLPILGLSFVLGLATNALGPERHINVLAVPLLGLVVWNVAVIAASLTVRMLPVVWGGERRPPRVLALLRTRARRWLDRRASDEPATARRVAQLYLERSVPVFAGLETSRLRRLLHLGSIATVLGVIVGMYGRGLLLEYRATWESTFLGAGAVDALLGTVLRPAAALLGRDVPSAATLRAPIDGPAGEWIHLWALTAVLFVVVPRALLSLVEHLKILRLQRRLPVVLPAAYVRRLRVAAATSAEEVQIVPYSYRPVERGIANLRAALLDLLGPRTQVRLATALAYGDEAPDPRGAVLRVVLFGLAQTPELEVHGEALERLRDELPDGQGLLVLIDEAPLRRKLPPKAAAERVASRQKSWRRVVEANGLKPLFVDLSEPIGDSQVEQLREAVYPSGWTAETS